MMMMMRFTTTTIGEAFRLHGEIYHTRRGWDIPYHIQCWQRAESAFERGSFEDFTWLYEQLRRYWQVFRRPAGAYWTPEQTFHHLRGIDNTWRERSLARVSDAELVNLRDVVRGLIGIKPTKAGASIVAISKFLHVFNPRCFMIVDDAIMWRWVLGHRWLREPIRRERDRIAPLLALRRTAGDSCDVLSYLAVLSWCAQLVRANPAITTAFADHVRRHAPDEPFVPKLYAYDAAAVEWFLLGVVEIPPAGMSP